MRIVSGCLIALVTAIGITPAQADEAAATAYTQQLYQRITGTPIRIRESKFRRMKRYVERGEKMKAARIALKENAFYSITLRNFSAPWTNEELTPQVAFDDLQALVIGIASEELDARLLLTGDLRYQAHSTVVTTPPSLKNNNHYEEMERKVPMNIHNNLKRVDDQWAETDVAAGVLTTRAWAKAHYHDDDTNRRPIPFAFDIFLCQPIDSWRFRAIPDWYVRRDVQRAPSGKPENYQNECRLCHAPMDAMAGAFARLDYIKDTGTLMFLPEGDVKKTYNRLIDHYPRGYAPFNDYWVNLLDYNPNIDFGWRSAKKGYGVKAFGEMLANSRAFSKCMARRTFEQVCARKVSDNENAMLDSLATGFEEGGYNLRELFGEVAIQDQCITHKGL